MSISLDEVRHVAKLARLDLQESEVMDLQSKLNSLLNYFTELEGIDASHITPQTHAVSIQNVWSQDIARPGISREAALANAAKSKAGIFVVPTIIED